MVDPRTNCWYSCLWSKTVQGAETAPDTIGGNVFEVGRSAAAAIVIVIVTATSAATSAATATTKTNTSITTTMTATAAAAVVVVVELPRASDDAPY